MPYIIIGATGLAVLYIGSIIKSQVDGLKSIQVTHQEITPGFSFGSLFGGIGKAVGLVPTSEQEIYDENEDDED